jgi:hypothetical protein
MTGAGSACVQTGNINANNLTKTRKTTSQAIPYNLFEKILNFPLSIDF